MVSKRNKKPEGKDFQKHRPCSRCQTGLMSLTHQTYYTWIKGAMLTVPDFPVWVCLVCGYEDYDARAMDWLHYVFEKRDRQIYVDQDGNPRLKRHQHPFQNSFFTIN